MPPAEASGFCRFAMQRSHPRRKPQPRARRVAANPDPVPIARADLYNEICPID